MSSNPWSELQLLQLSNCIMGADTVMCLARAHLPNLKHLSLCSVSLLDGSETFYELGSGGKWQALTTLELVLHVIPEHEWFMDVLILGDWPVLQNFVLTGRILSNHDIGLFTQAKWPALKCITLGGIMDEYDALTQCMQKCPDLEVSCLEPLLAPPFEESGKVACPEVHHLGWHHGRI